MRQINFHHLRYFWVVAHTGSVTLASRKLNLSQPSISVQLKQFEQALGEKLFERRGRGIALTENGKLVYRYANQIFSLGDELLEMLSSADGKSNAPLNIGISDVVPKSLAYRLIEPGLRAEAGCTLTCVEDKTERLLAELAVSELDIVVTDRPIPPNVNVKAFNHFIGECPVVFMGTKELKKRYAPKFPQSLLSAPVILPTVESAVRHELDRWFSQLKIEPRLVAEIQDRALMKIAAREGRGIVPIPKVIENEIRREYHLQRVGIAEGVQEKMYLITVEKRIKNPLSLHLVLEARRNLFS